MARTITVGQLEADVRSRADVENDPHKSPVEIRRWLSAGYSQLYDILVNSGLAYFESKQTIVTVGSGTTALPADYFGTLRIDFIFSAELIWPVKEINPRAIHRVRRTNAQRAYYYRITGSNITWYPTPPSGQTYEHLYIPAAADLTLDVDGSTVVDGINGWEEYVVLYAAMQACNKEDGNYTKFERQIAKIEQKIESMSLNRTIASATSLIEEEDYDDYYDRDPANWRQY